MRAAPWPCSSCGNSASTWRGAPQPAGELAGLLLAGQGQQVVTPWRQVHVQPGSRQLVTVPLEHAVVEQVGQPPGVSGQVGPAEVSPAEVSTAERDPPLGRQGGEVDDDDMPAPIVSTAAFTGA